MVIDLLPCPCEQIYIQDISQSKAELKLSSIPSSPIIDPHLSPDGSMLAYVRDHELHVLNLFTNESKQLTHGAKENGLVSSLTVFEIRNVFEFHKRLSINLAFLPD